MPMPVFVCDAHNIPLMPIAAAYARKLLATHRASLAPHPLVTRIKLHHAINNPHLRPVVAKLYPSAAYLAMLLLVERTDGVHALMHLAIEHSDAADRTFVLRELLRELHQFVPVSHLVIADERWQHTTSTSYCEGRFPVTVLPIEQSAEHADLSLLMMRAMLHQHQPHLTRTVHFSRGMFLVPEPPDLTRINL